MVEKYLQSTTYEKNVVIIHIYGARAISVLFCYHQDSACDIYETYISISKPIFNHKEIPKATKDTGIHTTKNG